MTERIRDLPIDDRSALFDRAAAHLDVEPGFIEKDYWAMEVLRSLARPLKTANGVSATVVFKGGTSLSKAYGLIERFSDDIDVFLFPESPVSRNAQRKQYLDPLTSRVAEDLGLTEPQQARDITHDNNKRNTRFYYPETTPTGAHSRGVLLELAFRTQASTVPGLEDRQLQSFIAEFLGKGADEFDDLSPFTVRVLSPSRTLLEKLGAVCGIYESWQAGDTGPLSKGARHFYDIYRLLSADSVRADLGNVDVPAVFELIEQVTAANDFITGSRPAEGFAAHAVFSPDAAFLTAARDEHAATQGLVYGDFPSFEACLEIVRKNHRLL